MVQMVSARHWLLLAAATLLPILLFFYPLSSFDIWWHLDSGRWMLEHGEILLREIRSFTAPGREWVNHAWLFQLATAAIEQHAGLYGVLGLKAVLWAGLFFLLASAAIKRDDQVPGYVIIILLAAPAIAGALVLRPHLVEYLLLLVLVRLFHCRLTPRLLPTYAILLILWANTHASAPVAAAAIGLHILFSADRAPVLTPWPTRILVAATIGLGIFATPHGLSILELLTRHGESLFLSTYILEWKRPDGYSPVLLLLLVLTLFGAARRLTRLTPGELFLLLVFVYLGLTRVRFANEVILLLIRPAAQTCAFLLAQTRDLGRWLPALSAVLFTASWATLSSDRITHATDMTTYRSPFTVSRLPVATSRLLGEIGAGLERPVRVLNTYEFGGFIAWSTNGRARIYIDGRTPTIFTEKELLEEVIGLSRPWVFKRITGTQQVDAVLIDRETKPPIPPGHAQWALVGYDEASLLYLRRDRLEQAGVAELGYDPGSYRHPRAAPPDLDATRRLLALEPRNARAWNQLGALLVQQPQPTPLQQTEALAAFAEALAIEPRDPYATLQTCYLLLDTRRDAREEIARLVFSLPSELPAASPAFFEIQAAEILLRIGRAAAALETLSPSDQARTRALDLDPLTWILRARAQLALGRPAQAWLPFYMAHLSVDPGNVAQIQDIQAIGVALGALTPPPGDTP